MEAKRIGPTVHNPLEERVEAAFAAATPVELELVALVVLLKIVAKVLVEVAEADVFSEVEVTLLALEVLM